MGYPIEYVFIWLTFRTGFFPLPFLFRLLTKETEAEDFAFLGF